MESSQNEMNFGRQPKPVTIIVNGDDKIDVDYWMRRFIMIAQSSGDDVTKFNHRCFRIYPRAVND